MVHHGNGTEVSRKTFRHKLLFLYVILRRFTRKLRGNVSSHSPLGWGEIVGNPSSFFRPLPFPSYPPKRSRGALQVPPTGSGRSGASAAKAFFSYIRSPETMLLSGMRHVTEFGQNSMGVCNRRGHCASSPSLEAGSASSYWQQ